MKKHILFFCFVIIGLSFGACNKDDDALSDAELILAIQNASNKQTIDATALPTDASALLGQDYSESFIEIAQLAPEYGYEVSMRRGEGSRIGERNEIYFNREGRQLRREGERGGERTRGEEGRDREECFELVFPITLVMPDGTEITGENAVEIRTSVAEWYENNPNVAGEPQLQFPVDIVFEDGSTLTVNSHEEIREAYSNCR